MSDERKTMFEGETIVEFKARVTPSELFVWAYLRWHETIGVAEGTFSFKELEYRWVEYCNCRDRLERTAKRRYDA